MPETMLPAGLKRRVTGGFELGGTGHGQGHLEAAGLKAPAAPGSKPSNVIIDDPEWTDTEDDAAEGANVDNSEGQQQEDGQEEDTDAAELMQKAIEAMQKKADPAALKTLEKRVTKAEGRIEALEKKEAPETIHTFRLGDEIKGRAKGARPECAEIVRLIAAGLKNVWLAGPAGSGKTTLARTVSEALGARFGYQSFGPDITKGDLIGGVDVQGNYHEPAFVDFYEKGGVYLLDEIDAADASILLVLNAALDNGHLSIPRHPDPARRIIARHPETVIICAANTWGTGPDSQYIGRAQLDAAFLDRFTLAQLQIDYDMELEKKVCPDSQLRATLQMIRQKIKEHKIRRIVGTRAMVKAGQLYSAGFTISEIKERLLRSWTPEERAKVTK